MKDLGEYIFQFQVVQLKGAKLLAQLGPIGFQFQVVQLKELSADRAR